jgi:hypothetical protein
MHVIVCIRKCTENSKLNHEGVISDWSMASFNLSNEVSLEPEEIKRITKLFKKNVNLSALGGGILVKFYQAMLTTSL